jgi:ankyrin repeat protein
MNAEFFELIRRGVAVEIAEAVATTPELASSRNRDGVSALLWAVYCGQEPARDLLRAKLAAEGVALDVFEAAATGDEAGLRAILKTAPESAHAFSRDGWTPLHLAAAFGTPGAVSRLLAGGASVDALSRNAQKNQPLHAAIALGKNPETVRLLLDHGAQANAIQAGGFTAIFSAAASNRRDLAKLLISHGADARHRSESGKTPAEFARERGHAELAAWLEALPAS